MCFRCFFQRLLTFKIFYWSLLTNAITASSTVSDDTYWLTSIPSIIHLFLLSKTMVNCNIFYQYTWIRNSRNALQTVYRNNCNSVWNTFSLRIINEARYCPKPSSAILDYVRNSFAVHNIRRFAFTGYCLGASENANKQRNTLRIKPQDRCRTGSFSALNTAKP
jgi:hypothetical protein